MLSGLASVELPSLALSSELFELGGCIVPELELTACDKYCLDVVADAKHKQTKLKYLTYQSSEAF